MTDTRAPSEEDKLYERFLHEGQTYLAFLNALDRFAAHRLSTTLRNPSEEVRETVGRAIAEAMSDIQLGSTIHWEDLVFRRDAMKIADAAIAATAQKITGEG